MSDDPATPASPSSPKLSPGQILAEELPKLKWRVLIFACFLTFGQYYIYDFPGSIGVGPDHSIQAKFAKDCKPYNQAMNLALYSVYSWPNSVLAMVGGLLIDKYLGLRRAMLLFCTFICMGAALFYVGVLTTNYPLMVVARVLYGLGGESNTVAQSAFVARWFKKGRGMALAFGICISFSRVGSSFNFMFSPRFASAHGINFAVLMGLVACLISLVSCFMLIWMDIIGAKRGDVPPESHETATPFSFKEIKELSVLLWLACGICVLAYCSLLPFIGVAENFFMVKFHVGHTAGGTLVSLFQYTGAGGSPVVGFLVDNVGRFCYWIIGSCTGFVLIHVLLVFTMIPAAVQMVALGLTYSCLVSSLWPCIPYCVEPAFVGFAYGVITSLQNLGLASWPLVVGAVLDRFVPAETPTSPSSNQTNATNSSHYHFFHLQELNAAAGGSSSGTGNGATSVPGACNVSATHKPPLPTLEGYKYAELIFILSAGISVLLAIAFFIVDRIKHKGMLSAAPERRAELKLEYDAEKESLLNADTKGPKSVNDF